MRQDNYTPSSFYKHVTPKNYDNHEAYDRVPAVWWKRFLVSSGIRTIFIVGLMSLLTALSINYKHVLTAVGLFAVGEVESSLGIMWNEFNLGEFNIVEAYRVATGKDPRMTEYEKSYGVSLKDTAYIGQNTAVMKKLFLKNKEALDCKLSCDSPVVNIDQDDASAFCKLHYGEKSDVVREESLQKIFKKGFGVRFRIYKEYMEWTSTDVGGVITDDIKVFSKSKKHDSYLENTLLVDENTLEDSVFDENLAFRCEVKL